MIEVEIRGELTAEQSEALKERLGREGKHLRRQDREAILLRDYPGYHRDPTKREADLRIRKTNGKTEFMLKRKVGTSNVARHELALPIEGDGFDAAKSIAVAFGCTGGLWMHRISELYKYDNIEWTVVEAIRRDGQVGMRFYEAEALVESAAEVPGVREQLITAATSLGLPILDTDDAMREFIYRLDDVVNEEITLHG